MYIIWTLETSGLRGHPRKLGVVICTYFGIMPAGAVGEPSEGQGGLIIVLRIRLIVWSSHPLPA